MHNASNVLLSEYLKKWYIYKPVSYTFSQSYHNVAIKRKEVRQ